MTLEISFSSAFGGVGSVVVVVGKSAKICTNFKSKFYRREEGGSVSILVDL